MKFNYFESTDSLYIDLSEKKSVESVEIAPNVVVDFDENGQIVGIDIDNASHIVNLKHVEFDMMQRLKKSA